MQVVDRVTSTSTSAHNRSEMQKCVQTAVNDSGSMRQMAGSDYRPSYRMQTQKMREQIAEKLIGRNEEKKLQARVKEI